MVSRLRAPGLLAALLIGLTAAIYAPTLRYPAVYEDLNDPGRYERAPFITTLANPSRLIPEMATDVGRILTPHAFQGQHAVNVAWHLLNCAIFWQLARRVLPTLGALGALAVFALHPMQVEAVAYVSGRADPAAASGVLLALLATTCGSMAGAVIGCVVASLAKESAVMAWALVPLWAIVTGAPFALRRFLMIGVLGAGVVLWRVRYVAVLAGMADLEQAGRTAVAMVGLTGLTAVPVWQSIDHDWRGAALWLQSLAVGMVVAGAGAAIWRWWHWLAFGWLVTVLWCLPRFLVRETEGLHEHHWDSAILIGWSLCVGGWLSSSQLEHARV